MLEVKPNGQRVRSVLFFSRPRSDVRTFSIYPCPLSF